MSDHLTYPVYFLKGYMGYENEEMWDINSAELEMIDIEAETTDDDNDENVISGYEIVQIDEYEISNKNIQTKPLSIEETEKVANSKKILQIQEVDTEPNLVLSESSKHFNLFTPKQLPQTVNLANVRPPPAVGKRKNKNACLNTSNVKQTSDVKNASNALTPYPECPLCKILFPKFGALKQHFEFAHPGKECHIICCDRRLTHPKEIVDHIYHEHEQEPDDSIQIKSREYEQFIQHYLPKMRCAFCSSEHNSFVSLKEHFMAQHPEEICSITCCNRKFSRLETITEHIRVHLDPQTFHCRLCNKSYMTKVHLDSHMRQTHAMLSNNLLYYYSADVSRTNKSVARIKFEDLNEFITAFIPQLKCVVCSAVYQNFSQYIRHFAVCHPCFKCKIVCCGLHIHERHDIEEHIHLHNDPSGFMCIVCRMKFRKRSYLFEHMCRHHPFSGNSDVLNCKWVEEFNKKNIPIISHIPKNKPIKQSEEKKPKKRCNEKTSNINLKDEEISAINKLLLEWGTRAHINDDQYIGIAEIKKQANLLRNILNVDDYKCDKQFIVKFYEAVAKKSQVLPPGSMYYSLNYMDILENCKQRIHPSVYSAFRDKLLAIAPPQIFRDQLVL
ncbi:zinc finger protein 181-like [Musca vetustissima]|uniref:zinc finger protein 181-like n=1 Tax=Musca vetustissima TaxID=27455 RepID=UPI002AB6F21A|nr:zinc finger protein 181-like [Musca vetustissima]